MAMVTFEAQLDKFDASIRRIALTDAPRAGARALNAAARASRKLMVSAIRQELGVTTAVVDPYVRMHLATEDHLESRVYALHRAIPLMRLSPTGPSPSRGRGDGITVRAVPRRHPHAFFATMPTGHRGVWERVPGQFMQAQKATWRKRRQAIAELKTEPIANVFARRVDAGRVEGSRVLRTALVTEIRISLGQ